MHPDISSVLISEEQLRVRVKELAAQISADYQGKHPLFVCILKGAVVFFSDLFRAMKIDCTCDFLGACSYGADTCSSGRVDLYKDVTEQIKGRDVIVVEDIYDTGITLDFVKTHLQSKQPASLSVCVLLDKPARRKPGIDVRPEYVGFTIDPYFVVGYGLDCDQEYRHLPYIGIKK
ncbi:MAG: hypoxanthine phosphoribosyltransferase [Clostridia bacterium]|nr:hypoxanthine phosphoribosyltransferase [Clostridia bacterium]